MTASNPLIFDLVTDSESWSIQGPASPPRHLANPLAEERFRTLAASLREWASRPVPLDRPDPLGTEAFVQGLARRVSDHLTQTLLTEEDRRLIAAALTETGRARLVIRVHPATEEANLVADAALALPWELLAPETSGVYPVRDGRLSVIREAVTDAAPELPEPSGPLTLAVMIAAPEDRAGFPYEQESFRLLAALAPLGQRAVFSNLGGLDDLADLVADIRATAIHFRGHGLPGGLLFEDGLGFAAEVPVGELRRRLAAGLLNPQRAGDFPGLFFLAAPFSALDSEETSTAAALHRSGFAQVIGFFGPVNADLNTNLEERFYRALASGQSALVAAEEARTALLEPVGEAGERVRYPFVWSQLALYHRGPDLPLARPGQRKDVQFVQRRTIEVSGLPVLEHGFIGRRGLQHEVRRKVERDGQRLVVIQGLGGLGKTALASQLLVRAFAPEPADQLVLRCRELAETDADPVLELRAQAEEHGRILGLPFWDERVKDLRERVPEPAAGLAAVLRLLRRDRPSLAVYVDNAETLQTGPATDDPAALGSWRPGLEAWWQEMERLAENEGCLVLTTTRYAWKGLSPRAHVGLPPMGPADSLRLIDSFEALGDLPLPVRTRLAERVDGHPRTIEFLDRLIAQRREEIRKIEDVWNDLIAPVLPAQEEKIRTDLLIEKLWDKLSEEAKKHALALTVLRRPAPQFVIDRIGGGRDELVRTGWLTRYREHVRIDSGIRWSERWGLQCLTQTFLAPERQREMLAAHRAAADAWENWIRQPSFHHEDQAEAIHHLHAIGEGDRAWPLVEDHVQRLMRKGRYIEAQTILEQCEPAKTTSDRLARSLMFRVQVRRKQGDRNPELGLLLERALTESTSETDCLKILHDQGSLLSDQGKYRKAKEMLREALTRKKNVLGSDHPSYGASLHELGVLLDREGHFVEAEALLRESLVVKRRNLGSDHVSFGASLHALAGILGQQNKYAEAEETLQWALSVEEETLGIEHPEYAASLHELAGILMKQGRLSESESILRRCLLIKENTIGKDHPSYAISLHDLAGALKRRGHYREAEHLLAVSLAIKESSLGPDHPLSIATLHSLAEAQVMQGKLEEAALFLQRAAQSYERSLGPDHPRLYPVLTNLGSILVRLGNLLEGERLLQRALLIACATGGATVDVERIRNLIATLPEKSRSAEPPDKDSHS